MLTYTAMSELTRGRLGGSSAFSAGYVGCLRPCDGELPRAVVPMVLTHTYIQHTREAYMMTRLLSLCASQVLSIEACVGACRGSYRQDHH